MYIYIQSITSYYSLDYIYICIYIYKYIESTLLYSHVGGWSSMMFGDSHLEVGVVAGLPTRQRCGGSWYNGHGG